MHRADGIEFAVAAFTNLSQDHLDFHADIEDYFAAKARLFDGRARAAVIVVDDEWGQRLAAMVGRRAVTVSSGAADATWRASEVTAHPDGSTAFRVLGPGVDLPAGFAQAVVPGRMERVAAGQPFLVVVDYAHKPAAVEGALRALRPLTPGRLIIVLGCGGDRDRAKRPLMGELAARNSDLLIITDDNPRSEDPALIRQAMLAGALAVPADARGEVLEVGDRAEAIGTAVAAATPGDTVLVAGKGHERGQEIAGVVYPFDDRDVLRAALGAAP
jgi:UDP-N-acetylmuramoyl-L-alanyl-D-glutamate--2,6-diaminopimelate ligase